MMARFYAYIDKVFQFRRLTARLTDSRPEPVIPTAAVFGTAFAMFATCRGSLNGIDKERHFPGRLRNFVGPRVPSGDTVGRVYAAVGQRACCGRCSGTSTSASNATRCSPTPRTGCSRPWTATSFFASRKRCCDQCLTRTLTVDDQEVTEYYHRGVVCHLIGQDLAIPLDVEFQRPGEGEVPAAKRLLERVFANYRRYFDAVVGDGLYFEAPFINFCLEHHKHVVVVVKGDHRLLLQDAQGLFSPKGRRRAVDRGPANGPVLGRRGLHLLRRRVGAVAGVAHPGDRATPRTDRRPVEGNRADLLLVLGHDASADGSCPPAQFWRAGHWRWDIENDCFNTHLHPLGPGPRLQARTDGDRQFRAHAVPGVRAPAMLLAAEPQASATRPT